MYCPTIAISFAFLSNSFCHVRLLLKASIYDPWFVRKGFPSSHGVECTFTDFLFCTEAQYRRRNSRYIAYQYRFPEDLTIPFCLFINLNITSFRSQYPYPDIYGWFGGLYNGVGKSLGSQQRKNMITCYTSMIKWLSCRSLIMKIAELMLSLILKVTIKWIQVCKQLQCGVSTLFHRAPSFYKTIWR